MFKHITVYLFFLNHSLWKPKSVFIIEVLVFSKTKIMGMCGRILVMKIVMLKKYNASSHSQLRRNVSKYQIHSLIAFKAAL